MKPIYPYIEVERITDSTSSLVQTVEPRPVVKAVAVPMVPQDEMETVRVGQKILVNHVEEYIIDGEKLFFVHIKDIVCIV